MMKRIIIFMISLCMLSSLAFAEGIDTRAQTYMQNGLFSKEEAKQIIFRLFGLDRIEIEKPESLQVEEVKNYKGTVYLTFDDGPTKDITPQILDILKQYDIKATFFTIGDYVGRSSDIIKRAYEEGHEIANHSYTHKKGMFNSIEVFKNEITKANKSIRDVTGKKPKFFRVPYGVKLNDTYKQYLADEEIEVIGWNCETYDSRGNHIKAEDMLNAVKRTMKNNKKVIVIMHDTYGKQETVKALPNIIEYFNSINYEFKKIGE